jgi:hypothetical protein
MVCLILWHARCWKKANMSKIGIAAAVFAVIATGWFLRKFRRSIRKEAPTGYEDEGGFHFGVPSGKE